MSKKPVKKIIVSKDGKFWSWSGCSSTGGRIIDSAWHYKSKASAIARARLIAAQLDVPVEYEGEKP